MSQSPWSAVASDDHVLLRAGKGRGWRQLLVLVPGLMLFLVMLVLGVATLVFSWLEGWRSGAFWIGGFFGWMFTFLGLISVVSAVEGIGRILITRPGHPVLEVDARGIGDGRHPPTAWADLTKVLVVSSSPPVRQGKYGAMDRAVGRPLRIRDGQRAVRMWQRDGTSRNIHLTLPIGSEEFGAAWQAIAALGQRNGVPVEFTGDVSRRFS